MATSNYFQQYGGRQSERDMYQDLFDEQIFLFGSDVKYIPRVKVRDDAMNDLIISRFNDFATIEMFLINVEGFGSPSEMMSKFGLKITDEVTFVCSKRRWLDYVDPLIDTTIQSSPNDGDLIYYPLTNDLYEIKFVEREIPFYALGQQYVFQMTAEIWQPGNSIFETGDDDIDGFGYTDANVIPIFVKVGGTGAFTPGEIIEQTYTTVDGDTITASAKVVEWQPTARKLRVTDTTGQFRIDENIEGQDTGAIWEIQSFSTIDFELTDYEYAQNKYYETKGDSILDFTETNPFGEYGNMGGSF